MGEAPEETLMVREVLPPKTEAVGLSRDVTMLSEPKSNLTDPVVDAVKLRAAIGVGEVEVRIEHEEVVQVEPTVSLSSPGELD